MPYQLTTDKQERKRTPIFSGLRKYFPLAMAAISRVSWAGNEQHNPGEPLHWARGKSDDHLDAADRHLTEYAMGNPYDEDGEAHLAKASWRINAQLQLDEEQRLENEKSQKSAEPERDDWRKGTLWDRDPRAPELETIKS